MQNKRRDFLKLSGVAATMVASEGYLFAKTGVTSIENSKRKLSKYNIYRKYV